MRKILITASAVALTVLGASAASANPKNVFSEGGVNYVTSYAASGVGNATSESYNTSDDAVSYQELSASAYGASLSVTSIPVFSGNANVSDIHDNHGVTMSSANTGNGSVAQQAVSLAAVGSVTIN
ncbi:MAG TPA: hypothetical protein VM659_25575 [Dongiaceae bacterium]|nr:hypothetical protein [Dongiaceae bacterium]